MVGRQQAGTSGIISTHVWSSLQADPDMWMRPAIKSNGNTYYEYILLYVDDALVVSENAESIL